MVGEQALLSVCFLYARDYFWKQVLEGVDLVFQCTYVDVGAGYVVVVDRSYDVGEVLGDSFDLLSPGLPHFHSFDDHVVLCSEVVPMFCDLLFQGVVVQFDTCVDGFGFLFCFPLPLIFIALDGSCGLVLG